MDERLDGWLEIGAFFGIDPRTAQRWGLKVHHLRNTPKSPVFAFESELLAWAEANNVHVPRRTDDIADHIVERVADLLQAKNLYRRNFFMRFSLQKFGLGVKAQVYTQYEIVNGSNKRQPYTQEVTTDDCENGHVELLSVSVDQKPIYLAESPKVTEYQDGYSSYKGRTILIEPSSMGKRYIGIAKWTVNRRDNDFWYVHCGIPTLGIGLETRAPSDIEITRSYSSKALLTYGQHFDIAWKMRRH